MKPEQLEAQPSSSDPLLSLSAADSPPLVDSPASPATPLAPPSPWDRPDYTPPMTPATWPATLDSSDESDDSPKPSTSGGKRYYKFDEDSDSTFVVSDDDCSSRTSATVSTLEDWEPYSVPPESLRLNFWGNWYEYRRFHAASCPKKQKK